MTTLELIAAAYRLGRHVIQGQCADLNEEEFHHHPVPGANSAAWVVGHLALSARRTAERIGARDLPAISEDFVEKFKATRLAAGSQNNLGTKGELLALFDTSTNKLLEQIPHVQLESLSGPATVPIPFLKNFGEQLVFGAMHFTMHAGQISTIRRSLGKPPLV